MRSSSDTLASKVLQSEKYSDTTKKLVALVLSQSNKDWTATCVKNFGDYSYKGRQSL